MKIESFLEQLQADFFTGVPDSQLKALCNYLHEHYGADRTHHVIAANEGNAVAIAAGYHLATDKIPVVYMQNSGEGNAVNPLASLMHPEVYAIPAILIIGWRGEPGVKDEPQHVFQGKITTGLPELMEIPYLIVGVDTTEAEVAKAMEDFRSVLDKGGQVAFVIRKDALRYEGKPLYRNAHSLSREDAVRCIAEAAAGDLIVSTTGKTSRELFEIREQRGEGHEKDFLTVGSMGHSSSIALGIALQKKDRRVWCIDGDGAALMHMGAMAVAGTSGCDNLIHVLINNEAHESVGGLPTVADKMDFVAIAKACGYAQAVSVADEAALREVLADAARRQESCFIEVKCAIGSREDLGRPTQSTIENKEAFVGYLRG